MSDSMKSAEVKQAQQRMVDRAIKEWTDTVTGRVAVVTGGARGIGMVLSQALIRAGAKVVALDKSWNGSDDFRKELEGAGGLAIEADITSDSDLDAAYDAVISKYGTVDVLLNNAALVSETLYPPTGHINTLETKDKDWEDMFRVNVFGTVKVTRRFVEPMRKQRRGSIINVVSSGVLAGATGGGYFGARPWTAEMPYQATKAAVTVLGFYLGEELKAEGVAVNSLMPGHTRASWFDDTARAYQKGGVVYFNRPVVPEHMVPLTLFLAAQGGNFGVNGRLYSVAEWNYDHGYGNAAAWQDQDLPRELDEMYSGLEAARPGWGRAGVPDVSFDAQSVLYVAALGNLKK